jgi:hypothetical protein
MARLRLTQPTDHFIGSTTMPNDTPTLDEIRRMAADIGMTRLNDAHLQSLQRATQASLARRGKLRTEQLTYADEPAHVFSLGRSPS